MLVTNPFAQRSFTREVVRSISSGWWVLFITGLISVVTCRMISGLQSLWALSWRMITR